MFKRECVCVCVGGVGQGGDLERLRTVCHLFSHLDLANDSHFMTKHSVFLLISSEFAVGFLCC